MALYLLAAASAVGMVFIAAAMVRRLHHLTDDGEPDGATGTHAGAMLAAMFLLTFAIAIVVPWTTADSARMNTYTETQAIVETYWSAGDAPAPARQRIRAGLRDYVALVVDKEWPLMAKGRLSPEGWTRLEDLRRAAAALPTRDDALKDTRAGLLAQIGEISRARRERAMDARTEPPAGLLVSTILTGLTVVLFPFMAGARPRGATVLPLATMAALLGAGSYLVFDIAHPFDGALAVKADAFTAVLQELQRISGGG